jgi:4-hydroxybenzoate polyprenyltransferase
MFPLPVMIPAALLSFAAHDFTLQRLHGAPQVLIGWSVLSGAGTVFFLSLLMRAYDDLKDVETDLRLGKAGDPLYAERPLVTGMIVPSDLVVLRWIATAGMVGVAALTGPGWSWAAWAILMAVAWLSFKWFFAPVIQTNLLLAFLSHNPISGLLSLYMVALFVDRFGATSSEYAALLIVGMWLPIAGWEVSRKIRIAQDETSYDTYSRRLGTRPAALLAASLVAASLTCLLLLWRSCEGPWWQGLGLAVAGLLPLLAVLRLLVRPSSAAAKLRPTFELYMVATSLLMAAGPAVHSGLAWVPRA